MKKNQSYETGDAEVDMTPMLDIVFIMLIFFIVSSTFIHESGLSLSEQKKDETTRQDEKKAKAIIVQICSDQTILVDKRIVDIRAIRANVERKLAEDSRATVIIETLHKANTGTLVAVMDQARAAKANIAVAPMIIPCNADGATNALASLN